MVALAEAAQDRGIPDRPRSAGEQFDVVVHVHADTGTAEIEGGPALPMHTAQRLACQAWVSALITDRRAPLVPGAAPSAGVASPAARCGRVITEHAGSRVARTGGWMHTTSCRG